MSEGDDLRDEARCRMVECVDECSGSVVMVVVKGVVEREKAGGGYSNYYS